MPVYLTLQPIGCAARHIAVASGELLPHLFTLASEWRRLFSVTLNPTVTDSFPLENMVLFVARTFLSSFMDKMSDRPSGHTYKRCQPRIIPLWELRMKLRIMLRSGEGSTSASTRATASVTLSPDA